MAKLSDFQVQQPTRNFFAEELVARNAAKIHPQFHWSDTHIIETEGSAQSRPYLRDQAIDAVSRRKNLHCVLDRCLSDAGYTQDEGKRFHTRLDRLMDEEEEEEADPDEEEEEDAESALDSLQTELRRVFRTAPKKSPAKRTVRRSSSYVCDADYIARYLNPNISCVEAESWLYDKAYARQKSDPNRSYWCGLLYLLRSQPSGARIKDCKPQTLSMLVSKTLAA